MVFVHISDTTFIDGLYAHLSNLRGVRDREKLRNVVEANEYDSDALLEDISEETNDDQSNVSGLLQDKTSFDLIKQYIKDLRCM